MNLLDIFNNKKTFHRTYLIAEAGVNHNGNLKTALEMVRAAKKAGVDCIKFQTFKTEKVVCKETSLAKYQTKKTSSRRQYDLLKKLELSKLDFSRLLQECNKLGIEFLSTPFDKDSLNLLLSLGVRAIKVSSGDLSNLPFLELISKSDVPAILSTGMATLSEIGEALELFRNKSVCLLHCISLYPTPLKFANLKAIETLRNRFRVPVGFSDHTKSHIASMGAVAFGVKLIERHFTLDRSQSGPDHLFSDTPSNLSSWVRKIRLMESAIGDGVKKPTLEEEAMKNSSRKYVVASKNIKQGTVLKAEMLSLKRTGEQGIEPKDVKKLIGCKILRDVRIDQPISWDMF